MIINRKSFLSLFLTAAFAGVAICANDEDGYVDNSNFWSIDQDLNCCFSLKIPQETMFRDPSKSKIKSSFDTIKTYIDTRSGKPEQIIGGYFMREENIDFNLNDATYEIFFCPQPPPLKPSTEIVLYAGGDGWASITQALIMKENELIWRIVKADKTNIDGSIPMPDGFLTGGWYYAVTRITKREDGTRFVSLVLKTPEGLVKRFRNNIGSDVAFSQVVRLEKKIPEG